MCLTRFFLFRSDSWLRRYKNQARESEGKESFLETFWCTTTRGFYSLAAAVTDGKARYKNWVRAYSSRRNVVYTYVPPYSRVIFTSFLPRRNLLSSLLTPSHKRLASCLTLYTRCHIHVFVRMFRFREKIRFDKT